MYEELEDEFGDIVGKARRGLEISVLRLAEEIEISPAAIEQIESYALVPEAPIIRRLAQVLELCPEKLLGSSSNSFFPAAPFGRPVDSLSVEMLVLGSGFLMNGYLVGCPDTGKGVLVDPGFEAESILDRVEAVGLAIEWVLLTHGHGDHIGALSEVCCTTGARAMINAADAALVHGSKEWIVGDLREGDILRVGKQSLTVRETPGHTVGGVSFLHEDVVFVGDALFAGSVGGTRRRIDYHRQLTGVFSLLQDLPDMVVIYPGHGPATSVGEERAHNPFLN